MSTSTTTSGTGDDAQKWLVANLPADDAKSLGALFTGAGINTTSDVLLVSKDDLKELGVNIGITNRFLDAVRTTKATKGTGTANGGDGKTAPIAPPAPAPAPESAPKKQSVCSVLRARVRAPSSSCCVCVCVYSVLMFVLLPRSAALCCKHIHRYR